MATVLMARRVVNPGKIRRRTRRGNIGQIITLGLNPGKRKRNFRHKVASRKRSNPMAILTFGKSHKRTRNTMAKRRTARRRINAGKTYRRRRRTAVRVTHRRRTNPARRRYTHRRRNGVFSMLKRRTHRRRRNPGMLGSAGGGVSTALQIVGGALVTNTAMGMIPASLSSGVLGYLSTAAVAILQGMAIGKVFKSPQLGKNFQTGGFVILALKIVKDFFPSIGNPFGGMGLLAPSSFYNPQVPMPNSMVQFQLPAAISGAIPAPVASAGMGRMMRSARQGRY